MIQSTPVKAISGRDDAVIWPIVADGRLPALAAVDGVLTLAMIDDMKALAAKHAPELGIFVTLASGASASNDVAISYSG